MKRWIVFVALAGCGNSKGEAEKKLESAGDKVGDQATKVGEDVADKAKGLGDQAKDLGGKVVDKTTEVASDVADKASELSKAALATGKRVKAELDKVYKSTFDYDISVEATPEAAADHDARLKAMPSVNIGTTAVGYEQDATNTLLGRKYNRHFRATWRALDGRTVRLSFYTKEELDLLAFAKLLEKIVPVAIQVI